MDLVHRNIITLQGLSPPQTTPQPAATVPQDSPEDTLDRLEDGGPTRTELGKALIMLCAGIVSYDMRMEHHGHGPVNVRVYIEGLQSDHFFEALEIAVNAGALHADWAPGFNINPTILPRVRQGRP